MADRATVDNVVDERSDATRLQDRAIDGIVESMDAGKDAFLFGPTGVGKSRMFSVVAADRVEKDERVLVLSHRQNLVTQGQENMEKWVDRPVSTSIGMNGHIDQSGDVVYSTIQTAHECRDQLTGYKAAIIDEAHHVTERNAEYQETIEALIKNNPGILLMAASATPPDAYQGLHPRLQAADKHVITFEEAIQTNLVRLPETREPKMHYADHGNIPDVVSKHRKSTKSVDLETGIGKAVSKMRGPDWAEQLVNQYDRHLADRKTLAFFDSIKEANAFIAEAESREEGYKIAALHSGQSRAENERLKAAFERGEIKALASVDMISEGYDIDCDGILLDKKTTSLTEYKQIIGRGSRGRGEEDGPRALLIDTGASTQIHGNIAAQAEVQNLRGGMERKTIKAEDLLPGAKTEGLQPWIEVKVPASDRSVWATNIGGAIVYAAPTEAGFAALASSSDRKGSRVELLQIEGQRKGMPSKEALADWMADAVLKSGSALARLTTTKERGTTELERLVANDWQRNSGSVERSIGMLISYPPAMRQQAHAMNQRHASL